MRHLRYSAVFALVVGLHLATGQAVAQVTVGLDRGTRELLERLPKEVRDQVVMGVNDSLRLLDDSVAKYLEAVESTLERAVANTTTALQCASIGTLRVVESEVANSVGNLLWTGGRKGLNPPNVTNYTKELSDAINEMRDNIKTKTAPTEILLAYSDLLMMAEIVRCAVKIAPSITINEAEAQIRRVYPPALEWDLIVGDRDNPACATVHDCVVKRRLEFENLVKGADPRDVKASSVAAHYDSVPATPELPTGIFRDPQIAIIDYEMIVMRIRELERLLEAYRAKRIGRAISLLNEAESEAKALELSYQSYAVIVANPNSKVSDLNSVIVGVQAISPKAEAASQKVDNALVLDENLTEKVSTIRKNLKATSDNLSALVTRGNEILDSLHSAALAERVERMNRIMHNQEVK